MKAAERITALAGNAKNLNSERKAAVKKPVDQADSPSIQQGDDWIILDGLKLEVKK